MVRKWICRLCVWLCHEQPPPPAPQVGGALGFRAENYGNTYNIKAEKVVIEAAVGSKLPKDGEGR